MAYLRRDEVLPDDAIVVRGGVFGGGLESLQEAALDEYERLRAEGDPEPVHGLSVCCLPGMTAEEIAETVGSANLPHPRMRTSTVGALQSCGYEVVPSEWRGHATLIFPKPLTEQDWHNLQESFGPPICNPVGVSRR